MPRTYRSEDGRPSGRAAWTKYLTGGLVEEWLSPVL